MNDTELGNIQQPFSPDAALEKIRAVVGEHAQDYLIVVSIKDNVHSLYKTKTGAYGMASMVCHDINQDWWMNKSKDSK